MPTTQKFLATPLYIISRVSHINFSTCGRHCLRWLTRISPLVKFQNLFQVKTFFSFQKSFGRSYKYSPVRKSYGFSDTFIGKTKQNKKDNHCKQSLAPIKKSSARLNVISWRRRLVSQSYIENSIQRFLSLAQLFFICHSLETRKKGIYCYRFTHCGVPVVVFDAAVVSFKWLVIKSALLCDDDDAPCCLRLSSLCFFESLLPRKYSLQI